MMRVNRSINVTTIILLLVDLSQVYVISGVILGSGL